MFDVNQKYNQSNLSENYYLKWTTVVDLNYWIQNHDIETETVTMFCNFIVSYFKLLLKVYTYSHCFCISLVVICNTLQIILRYTLIDLLKGKQFSSSDFILCEVINDPRTYAVWWRQLRHFVWILHCIYPVWWKNFISYHESFILIFCCLFIICRYLK